MPWWMHLTHIQSSIHRTQLSSGPESRTYQSHPPFLLDCSMTKHGIFFVEMAVLQVDSWYAQQPSSPEDLDPGGTGAQNLRRHRWVFFQFYYKTVYHFGPTTFHLVSILLWNMHLSNFNINLFGHTLDLFIQLKMNSLWAWTFSYILMHTWHTHTHTQCDCSETQKPPKWIQSEFIPKSSDFLIPAVPGPWQVCLYIQPAGIHIRFRVLQMSYGTLLPPAQLTSALSVTVKQERSWFI